MLRFPPVSIALAGLEHPNAADAAGLRQVLGWAKSLGVRGVQLNGAAAGLRARELDRSARRDLAATFKRLGLGFSGIDLWIPPEHFADAVRSERAVDAACGAIELAADLAALMGEQPRSCPVSITLPRVKGAAPTETASALVARADRVGGVFADCSFPWAEGAGTEGPSPLGVGLDPAAVLMAGGDPAKEAAGLGARLRSARLSDAGGGGRVGFGSASGRVDALAYGAALSMVQGGSAVAWVVFDGRGVRDPAEAIAGALAAWEPPAPA